MKLHAFGEEPGAKKEGCCLRAAPFLFVFSEACLKIEEMTNFCLEGVHFKGKNRRFLPVGEGFLTRKGAAYGQKDGFLIFKTRSRRR